MLQKEMISNLFFSINCIDFFLNYDIILITKTTRPGVFGQHGEF